MLDVWHTFPTQMGDHLAFITYNESYSNIAETDKRDYLLKIRVEIKKPTPTGMPTDAEFPALSALDEKLDDGLGKKGAVYVGRNTTEGHRYFYYYVDFSEQLASDTIELASKNTAYKPQYAYEHDPEKGGYWDELYPTDDDRQVIEDLKVLDVLKANGDKEEMQREIFHWAYFPDMKIANSFVEWTKSNNYKFIDTGLTNDKKSAKVHFSHVGTMSLRDITSHTIAINRKAKEMKGDYDGWETSVEK